MKKILLFLICSSSFFPLKAQTWPWGKQCTGFSNTTNASADTKGNAIFGGFFSDTASIEPVHLSTLSIGFDAFLAKFDSNSNLQWVKQSKCQYYYAECELISTCTDNHDNIYAYGQFTDTVAFDNDTLISVDYQQNWDNFLVKYNPSGNVVWARQSHNPTPHSYHFAEGVATDRFGNVFITGFFLDTVCFGPDTLKEKYGSNSNYDMYLVKYDSNGNQLWARQSVSNASSHCYAAGYGVGTDSSGNVYVTGNFRDTTIFNGDTLATAAGPGSEVFVVKYDANGNEKWARKSVTSIGPYGNTGYSVITDKFQNVYTTGYFYVKTSFGPDTLVNTNSNYGAYLVKYSPQGNVIWAKSINTDPSNAAQGFSLVTDTLGYIYWSINGYGSYGTYYALGSDTAFSDNSGITPTVLGKIDTGGKAHCLITLDAGQQFSDGLGCSPNGKYVYIGGIAYDTIHFGNDFINPGTGVVSFIARWVPCTQVPLAVNNPITAINTTLYPNPNNGVFTIGVKSEELKVKSVVEIYNMLGEKALTLPLSRAGEGTQIDMSNQPAGIYLYRVLTETGNLVSEGKFIIEK